jgi:Mn2+/Fe2+ NRAMP family transporter
MTAVAEDQTVGPSKSRLLSLLGPDLITGASDTGASDDDPSGIATYSQAGSYFGYALHLRAGSCNCHRLRIT